MRWLWFGRLGGLGGAVTKGLWLLAAAGRAVVGLAGVVGLGRVLVGRLIVKGAGGCRVGLSRRGARVWGGRSRGL